MRAHGNLSRWNDDRGFGFITPAQGSAELFVHISAFPRDGIRPRIGELVSFEVEPGNDGKQRAVRVQRPGRSAPMHRARGRELPASTPGPIGAVIGLLIVGAIGLYGYSTVTSRQTAAPVELSAPAKPSVVDWSRCDGRTRCPQMTSCAEATYFIQHCPATEMDGDHDGVPCEDQWCGVESGF
jgi:cold shock CspA family protein